MWRSNAAEIGELSDIAAMAGYSETVLMARLRPCAAASPKRQLAASLSRFTDRPMSRNNATTFDGMVGKLDVLRVAWHEV